MKLKTAHVVYYDYRSERDEDYSMDYLNWDRRSEYFDNESDFSSRLFVLKMDKKTRNIEVYHGTIMKSYEESEA